MNTPTVLIIVIVFLIGVTLGIIIGGTAAGAGKKLSDYAGSSTIVEHAPFVNIDKLPFDSPIRWLGSRASFSNNGLAIVGHEMLVTSIEAVDEMVGELHECKYNQ